MPALAANQDPQVVLEVRNRQINAVHVICSQLSNTLDLDERLQSILHVSMQAVEALAGSILLYRPEDDKLVFRHVVGPGSDRLIGFTMNAEDGIAGAVFQSGEALLTNKPRQSPDHRPEVSQKAGIIAESIVTIPLKYRAGRPVGVMQIVNKMHGEFDDDDLEVLEIVASIAAAAIENAHLHREAQLSAVAHAVGDLSHDIKNKVTPISLSVNTLWPIMDEMYADIARIEHELTNEQRERLGRATDSLREYYAETFQIVLHQVDEIQDYTRLIADALKGIITEPELVPHELSTIIEKQVAVLEGAARSHGVRLECDLAPVPPCRFDRFQVERAVYNLVNNAIPETPAGGSITVRTRIAPEGCFPDGSCLLIEVEDTGRGMPTHVLERLLRGDAKSTKPGGTGLGTRIVFNAAAAHRGRFEGESREGRGTTLRVRLPYLPA